LTNFEIDLVFIPGQVDGLVGEENSQVQNKGTTLSQSLIEDLNPTLLSKQGYSTKI
jgi:hypothetical protein